MATNGGPKIIKNGMDLMVDPSNPKILPSAKNTNLVDYSTWVAGNTSATGFSRNGSTAENMILSSTGPFGETALVWETRPSGNGNADGGWNGSYTTIDTAYAYRISIWMQRTSVTSGGTFYLGSNGGGSCLLQSNNGSAQCNPYFECYGTGGFDQNLWYLVIGHVLPVNSANNTRHPDSGVYTRASGQVREHHGCNVGPDMRFASGTTSIRHRAYHYYCSDSTTRLQFAYPRIDKIDGTEPTVISLLDGGSQKIINPKNRSVSFFMKNNLRTKPHKGWGRGRSINTFDFDGTDDIIETSGGDHTSLKRSIEMVFKVNSSNSTYMPMATYTRGGNQSVVSGKRIWLGIQSNKFQMHGWGTNDPASTTSVTDGSFYHVVYAYDQTTKYHNIWINGVLETTLYNTESTGMGSWGNSSDHKWFIGGDPDHANWTSAAGSNFDGEVAIFRTYNKILSTREVKFNFNSLKRKFSI